MIHNYYFSFIILALLKYSHSLQSGYTCETSVTLTCPDEKTLLILEVTYSSECPSLEEEKTGGSTYAPSRCIGYFRERASTLCNGQRTCTIDNNLGQRPSFFVGKQANCEFKGQSINIDYSCIPDFYSSKLPRVDICSLQSLHGVTEGFIHTPNYPNGYPNNLVCSKTVPSPDSGHRLKIYALNFDVEGLSVLRFLGIKRMNDWFQINNSGEKMSGTLSPYTLLFDDIIEASLMFKSDFANTKRSYSGFLLYFVALPIRTSRPSTTSTITTTLSDKSLNIDPLIISIVSNKDKPIDSIQSKSSALMSNDRRQNNVGLTLLVVLLSGILFVCFCAFILYKRRNDRRVRYLTEMFNSFFPNKMKNVSLNTTDNNDETILNNTVQSKLDSSSISRDEKYIKTNDYNGSFFQTPKSKHVNINEKRETLEKQIFIENLKTCPSPYAAHRRTDNKFNAKEQINGEKTKNSNIYSQDPLAKMTSSQNVGNDTLLYEYIDLNQPTEEQTIEEPKQEEVIYDVINPSNERRVQPDTDYDSGLYATPKDV